jgi:spermidine/putrescine ABC transporter ATP-binding subunit
VSARIAPSIKGAAIELVNIVKRYAASPVVDNVSLRIEPGEFVSLLGPSGSGKTTTLMMVAGFVAPDEGRILLGEADITQVPPHRRDIGMVYQSYALFPHMTVTKNVAFPLRMRRLARVDIEARVRKALELVRMQGFGDRLPGQLSGGQQQRVALARALVFEPPLLLMDEPLGALDKKLREEMQFEIKRIQKDTRSTAVYVTHDQEEALNMSDRIVVMDHGRVEQMGTPSEIHDRPRTRFVADFMGVANLIETTVIAAAAGRRVRTEGGCEFEVTGSGQVHTGERVTVALRAERVLMRPGESASAGDHAGRLVSSAYRGSQQRHQVELTGGDRITVLALSERGSSAQPGEPVLLRWHPEDAWIIRM